MSPAAQCRREWERKGVVIDRWWLSLLMIPSLRVLSEARLVGVVKSRPVLGAFRDLLGSCSAVSCLSCDWECVFQSEVWGVDQAQQVQDAAGHPPPPPRALPLGSGT